MKRKITGTIPGLENVKVPSRLFCQNTANEELPEWLSSRGVFCERENCVMFNKRFHVHRAEHEALADFRATMFEGGLPSTTKILTAVTSSKPGPLRSTTQP